MLRCQTPLLLTLLLPASALAQGRDVVAEAQRAASAGTLSQFRRLWQSPSAPGSPRLAALALGTAARLQYRFDEARHLLRRAEGDTLKPDALAARAALGRAAIEAQQFRLPAADSLLQRARTMARRAGATEVDAAALLMLVPVRQRLEGVTAALATADSAARVLTPSAADEQIELSCRRAQALARLGDARALDLALAGTTAAAARNAVRLEGLCWQAVGQAHQMRDEIPAALRAFGTAAARHSASHDLAGEAAARQWQAFFQQLDGQFDSAQLNYRRAVVVGTASGNRAPVAWSWLGLARLSLNAGEPVRAADQAAQARRLLTDIGDRWGLATWSTLAGLAAQQLGDHPRALARLREAIARSDSLGAVADMVMPAIRLIDVERELNGERAALAQLAAVDALTRRTPMPAWVGERSMHLALLALRRGDGTGALAHLQRFQSTFRPSRSSLLPSFDFTVRLAEAQSLAGNPLEGARTLDRAIAEFAAWRSGVADRALRLAAWNTRGTDPDPDLGIATIIARTAAAGHDTLAVRLATARRTRDLGVRAPVRTEAPPPPGVARLTFVTGLRGEPTTLFVQSGGRLRSHALPPIDSLAPQLAAFRSLLSGDADAPVLARELGATLLWPAIRDLDTHTHTLLVVPAGALHALPWAALQLPDGRRVVERFAVALSPPTEPRTEPTSRTADVIAVGAGSDVAAWDGAPLAALPRAPAEARFVAALGRRGQALTGEAATEARIKALTESPPAILHIASHALVDARSASRAAILLRPARGEDGLLTADEIAGLHLPVQLAVLAGCTTATGLVLAAEGVQGLVRPLFDAGVQGVVASQWAVRDAASHRVMAWFYAELAAGRPTAMALRAAQLRAITEGMPAGDWAAWSFTGAPLGQTTATLHAPADRTRRRLIIGLLTVGLVAAAYGTLKRPVALRT